MTPAMKTMAEVEYAVMLAVLDFLSEFMKSHYSQVQVHLVGGVIEVRLARTTAIPAEEKLAESDEGRALLQRVQEALFDVGRATLMEGIERAVGQRVTHVTATVEPRTGWACLKITLYDAVGNGSVNMDAGVHRLAS